MSTPEHAGGVEQSDPNMPRAFGDYLLLHRLGRGGMGEVFLAKLGGIAGIEKLCVVKTLRSDLTADTEYKRRFIDEARVVVQLNHRNVCHVFDVGRVDGSYYLAMEYVSGRDLRTILRRAHALGVPVPRDVMLYLISEVLESLDYAHRLTDPASGEPLHLVHRDVSPQNVMVNFEGEVKLIDFGLAQSTMKVERTEPRIVMGKLAYMPPEQARGHAVDPRVDQFSVGVVAYEAITARSFYEGKSADEVWRLAGHGGFRPPAFAQLEPSLRAVLERSLSVDPAARYETCADMRQDLLRVNLKSGSMAGARELRELMTRLFGNDQESDRALLRRFANVKALDARPRGERPKDGKTERIATAVVSRRDVGLDSGPVSRPVLGDMPSMDGEPIADAETGPTETGTRPSARAARPEQTLLVHRGDDHTAEDEDLTETQHTRPTPSSPHAAEATELVRAPTAEQTMVVRDRDGVGVVEDIAPPARRRAAPVLIAGGAFLIVLVSGLAVLLLDRAPSTPETAPAVRVARPAPAPPAEPAPSNEAPAQLAVTQTPPSGDGPSAASPPAEEASPTAPSEGSASAKTPPAEEPSAKPAPGRASSVAAEPPADPARARSRSRSRSRPKRKPPPISTDAPMNDLLKYVRRHCMQESCASRALETKQRVIAAPGEAETQAELNVLKRCVEQCQR